MSISLSTSESLLTLKVIFPPANGFHKIRRISDALKKNAHDLNEQTKLGLNVNITVYIRIIIDIKSHSPANGFHKIMQITDALNTMHMT